MGWHFRATERLDSVLVPSKRDVKAGDSRVLERIGGKVSYGFFSLGMDRYGYTYFGKDGNDQVL